MKFICETFSRIGVIFQDESNEPSFIIIGYSGATVTTSNHLLIMRLKAILVTAHVSTCYSTIIVEVIL